LGGDIRRQDVVEVPERASESKKRPVRGVVPGPRTTCVRGGSGRRDRQETSVEEIRLVGEGEQKWVFPLAYLRPEAGAIRGQMQGGVPVKRKLFAAEDSRWFKRGSNEGHILNLPSYTLAFLLIDSAKGKCAIRTSRQFHYLY